MDFDLGRVRWGEYVVGVSGLVLLVSLFALHWYGLKPSFGHTTAELGRPTAFTGWSSLSHVRWLVLLTGLVALAAFYFQASRDAPAIPITLSVFASLFGLLSLIALVYRVLLSPPGGSGQVLELKAGAFVGLLGALALSYGGYLSMREEGSAKRDSARQIEVVRLPETGGT